MTDHETRAAIVELSRRLRDEPLVDDFDRFALEYLTWLRGHGWRPTEARVQPAWKHPAGHGVDPTADYLAARHALDEHLSRRGPGGDAA